jgi:hypothetical protein
MVRLSQQQPAPCDYGAAVSQQQPHHVIMVRLCHNNNRHHVIMARVSQQQPAPCDYGAAVSQQQPAKSKTKGFKITVKTHTVYVQYFIVPQ